MSFQIDAPDGRALSHLFDLTDQELEANGARRAIAQGNPGYPCRVSLEDAAVGEELILLNYEHLPETSPYRASHAIYVRKGAEQADLAPGEVPEQLKIRLLSVRGYGDDHLMKSADVVDGTELAVRLDEMFANRDVSYVHIHNAKPGCFAASATRADTGSVRTSRTQAPSLPLTSVPSTSRTVDPAA